MEKGRKYYEKKKGTKPQLLDLDDSEAMVSVDIDVDDVPFDHITKCFQTLYKNCHDTSGGKSFGGESFGRRVFFLNNESDDSSAVVFISANSVDTTFCGDPYLDEARETNIIEISREKGLENNLTLSTIVANRDADGAESGIQEGNVELQVIASAMPFAANILSAISLEVPLLYKKGIISSHYWNTNGIETTVSYAFGGIRLLWTVDSAMPHVFLLLP